MLETTMQSRSNGPNPPMTYSRLSGIFASPPNKSWKLQNQDNRLPQDINVNPRIPALLPTNRPTGISAKQNATAQELVAWMRAQNYSGICVNQQQVNAMGVRVGTKRPDVQGTSPAGGREYHEFDTTASGRGPTHEVRTLANDPDGISKLHIRN